MSDFTYTNLSVRHVDGVARLTLGGSNALNALDQETADELLQAVVELTEDETVRCIAIIGTGDAFGVGTDLSQLEGDTNDAPAIRRLASTFHDAIVQLHQAKKPVATAINGIAAGAGFSLALVGDIVLVSEEARLEYAYSRVGLTGDGGSTFFLPRLVGLRKAKEIALLNEPISPDEAVSLGIATETVPAGELDERLDELSAQLATGPTKAFGATKRLMTESFERALPTQLAHETDTIAQATRTEDYARGHAAFMRKDEPKFTGR
jgi:2-(1,2-epoxy-1,2-dihydrophenyl)acetyl-CoA isomerase